MINQMNLCIFITALNFEFVTFIIIDKYDLLVLHQKLWVGLKIIIDCWYAHTISSSYLIDNIH